MTEPNEPSGSGEERREGERAPVTLKVDYKRLNTFFADYTKNISKGGTFIRTDKPLEPGTQFTFVLGLPEPSLDNASLKIELTGVVKWVVAQGEATPANPAGMGIQFVFASDAERVRVERLVEDLMRTSLGDELAERFLARARTSGS